jgi:photosystem II stability/assembly factor-like uncharacterized protein
VVLEVTNVMQSWSAAASSADGSHLAAAVNGGLIYVSTNSGVTWSAADVPATNWDALVMSADGGELTAAATNGVIYSSTDSGATWTAANVPAADWAALGESADGAYLVAVVHGGVIYTSQTSYTPRVQQSTMLPGLQIQLVKSNVVLAWPAGGPGCVLQQSPDLMGTAWTDVPATPVATNGQNQVTLPVNAGQTLYRLRSQ